MFVSPLQLNDEERLTGKVRIGTMSYSASSTAGSKRLNHNFRKCTRSIRSRGIGGFLPASSTFG
jgi:hypothetical protein